MARSRPAPAPPIKSLSGFSKIERDLAEAVRGFIAPRMWLWLWISVALLAVVWQLAPHMLQVLLYKGVILTLAAFVADKIARGMETTNRRPHEYLAEADSVRAKDPERAWQLEQRADGVYGRRSLIIAAGMVAAALGS